MKRLIAQHKFRLILIALTIILLILYTFRFSTIFDEDYSLMLSNNTFLNIIKLDSFDVHPPLYYFLLKIFIKITTFWTTSFLIKIIFARIFAVIVSLITFIFLIKICKELGLYNKLSTYWLLFLIIPGVLSLTYEFIKIRMYSLSALFVTIEFYELIKYNNKFKMNNLICAAFMAILTFYTNYYAAFIAGIMLFIIMLKYLFKHNKSWHYVFISGIFTALAFIPWVPILIKQLSLQANHPQGSFGKQWVATLILIMIFIPSVIISLKYFNKKINYFYLISFVIIDILFFTMSGISIIDQSVFQFRYTYPIFVIYGFISINILLIAIRRKLIRSKILRIISIVILVILGISCLGSYINQTKYYGSWSISIVKQFHRWNNTGTSKRIRIKEYDNVDYGFNVEKAMYLSHYNKRFKFPPHMKFIKKNPAYSGLFKKLIKLSN